MFVLNSVLLGVGLAMDAVAVSMAEGMQEPKMKSERSLMLSGTFGFFQFIMPVLGFALVGTVQGNLMFQAIGTSVDALSLGFTFSHYSLGRVFLASFIIGIVTFFLCQTGIFIGKKFGTLFSGEADLLGGVILLLVIFLF